MAKTPIAPKRIVLKAKRDTLMLVVAATAATFALAASIHARPPEEAATAAAPPAQRDWTGELADAAMAPTDTSVTEPLTSDSLTVPKSAIALPNVPARAKVKTCEGAGCPVAKTPMLRGQTARSDSAAHGARKDPGLMTRLNPLNHLDTLQKPFVYAGNTISGWFRRF